MARKNWNLFMFWNDSRSWTLCFELQEFKNLFYFVFIIVADNIIMCNKNSLFQIDSAKRQVYGLFQKKHIMENIIFILFLYSL